MKLIIDDFLEAQNLSVQSETDAEYCLYCPFHDNTNTPSFYINKWTGLYYCHNPACGKKGRFINLVEELTGKSYFRFRTPTTEELTERLNTVNEVLGPIRDSSLDEAMERISLDYNVEAKKLEYLIDRGYHLATLADFEVGFSERQNRIVIPVRNINFKVVGFIGRATNPDMIPKYLYTRKFPRKDVLYNLHRAKAYDSVIVVEGSLDAMKVHQSGFPNVVSTLGSNLPPNHLDLLNQNFDEIIVFSDADEAGEKMKSDIIEGCARKKVHVVTIPDGLKDPGDMTEEQIRNALLEKQDILSYLYCKMIGEK